jgi:hypothetical protein
MAAGCFVIGVVIALATITVSMRMRLNILGEDIWILAIPAVLALIINVTFLEIYRKFRKNKGREKIN